MISLALIEEFNYEKKGEIMSKEIEAFPQENYKDLNCIIKSEKTKNKIAYAI